MEDIDLLLTPSAPGEAPAGLASTGDTSFNILSTWTYTPCVTLPVFTGPSGLPIGIQASVGFPFFTNGEATDKGFRFFTGVVIRK